MFDYNLAFSRNIGWVTEPEQNKLRNSRVAIAGMGGVGGSHLLTLTRLGIGKFHLSDFDQFGVENFNRQAGASLSSVGANKLDTMIAMARDINPELEIRTFREGVDESNVEDFLEGVDIYVDGLDFFAVKARMAVFSACHRLGVPATTAAPLGVSTAVLNFLPGKMSFEDYFQLEGQDENEQYLRFFVGLAPAALHREALVIADRIDLAAKKGPSTAMGCELCAGTAATQVLKILLNRGRVLAAPYALQFDAYHNKSRVTWRPGGNANLLQKLVLKIGRSKLLDNTQEPRQDSMALDTPAKQILDIARWAPSGDNAQCWRFELHSETDFTVHGFDTSDHVVYDLDGHSSQMGLGALLENIDIAAQAKGLHANITRRSNVPDATPTFDVSLIEPPDPQQIDPLAARLAVQIPLRAVQRRRMKRTPLNSAQKQLLESSLPSGYKVQWLENEKRWEAAKLMYFNADVRLTMPEAYPVHSSIIEWNTRYSATKLPDQALGADWLTLKLMKWSLASWKRASTVNKIAGTHMPRLTMDLIPGTFCAAQFAIIANKPLETLDDYVDSGRAWQRFWLAATSLNLCIQPQMTPLIFARYIREERKFTEDTTVQAKAERCAVRYQELLGSSDAERAVFLGRIGHSQQPESRSVRLPLQELLYQQQAEQ